MNYKKAMVSEFMTPRPIVCDPEMSVQAAASLMTEKGIGSVLIVEDGIPVGIVTERDIISKIVTKGEDPAKKKVRDIMTTPVITISPDADINTAASLMARRNIRRLPVVKENTLVGLVTAKDILRVSPSLFETLDHLREIAYEPSPEVASLAGYCESCGRYSTDLIEVNGQLLCEDCRLD